MQLQFNGYIRIGSAHYQVGDLLDLGAPLSKGVADRVRLAKLADEKSIEQIANGISAMSVSYVATPQGQALNFSAVRSETDVLEHFFVATEEDAKPFELARDCWERFQEQVETQIHQGRLPLDEQNQFSRQDRFVAAVLTPPRSTEGHALWQTMMAHWRQLNEAAGEIALKAKSV